MKLPRREFLHLAAAAAALPSASRIAAGQSARALRILVPFPPGAATDFLARLLAQQLGHAHGMPAIVENRPGAGSVIGTDAVSRAAPDGNTILLYSKEAIINPHVRKVNYDPLTSFEPICRLVTSPIVYSVNKASPYRTFADLIDAARATPGTVTVAASGPASPFQIGLELLKRVANVDMVFVPFPGGAPAMTAVLGGHVTSIMTTTSAVYANAANLRPLAVAARARHATLPEVPTVQEFGYPDYEVDVWYGLVAPARTPEDTISQLADYFIQAIQVPEVRAKLTVQGLDPAVLGGADFRTLLRKQYEDYGRIIREAKIKTE